MFFPLHNKHKKTLKTEQKSKSSDLESAMSVKFNNRSPTWSHRISSQLFQRISCLLTCLLAEDYVMQFHIRQIIM